MAPESSSRTVLLLNPAEDAALAAALRDACPEAQVVAGPFTLEGWLRALYEAPPVGAVLDTAALSLADLNGVAATRRLPRAPWLVLLVGDRGMAGCERLLADPRSALLPRPWTPAGLRAALDRVRAAPARGESFPGPFVEGLVEGLRDPLTALSGYLQLLGDADRGLVDPAMAAAEDLAQQLGHARLAARPAAPHVERLDPADALRVALEDARHAGVDARMEAEEGQRVDADPAALRAALACGRRLLARFGPGGPLLLRLARDADGVEVGWHAEPPAEEPVAADPPPAYLPVLFERLAARIPAEAVLDRAHGRVPVTAALRWSLPQG